MKIKNILTKDKKLLLSIIPRSNPKNKFLKSNFKAYKNTNHNYDRNIKIYLDVSTYKMSPIVKSGIKLYKVVENNKTVGFTLSYKQEKGMIQLDLVPSSVRVAFDKDNKTLKLVGKDAMGAWQPLITPLYNEFEQTKYSKNGITMSEACTTRKAQKNETLPKIKN